MRVNVFAVLIAAAIGQGLLPVGAWGQESQVDALAAAAKDGQGGPEGALALGHALRRAGRNREALTELRAAVARAPASQASAPLYVEIARVFVDTRDFTQCMATCKRLENVSGARSQAHACAAEAQFIRQRASEALLETAAALAVDPHSYDAKVAEGHGYELELDTTKAEASLREAIALDDGNPRAHLAIGRVLLKEERRDEGIAELRKTIAKDPLDPEALFQLATTLGPGAESVTLLQRATRERPVFADAWLALGVQELAGGHTTEASKAAASAARADPSNMHVRVLLGQIALAEGHPDEAIQAGNAVRKVVANDAAAALLVGDGNAKKGEIDAALEAYQAAWGLDHSNPVSLVNASVACHAAGRDTSARAFGVKATQEFPAWGPGWVALGDALVGQGEKQSARDAYQKALATTAGAIDRDSVQRKIATR